MGKIKLDEWLYWSLPLIRDTRKRLLLDRIEQQVDLGNARATIDDLKVLIECGDRQINELKDQLAAKTLEHESLLNKIVERAQVQPIIRAKSAAEIRRMVEAQNEREFEESANGI